MSYKELDQAEDMKSDFGSVNEVVSLTGSIFNTDANVKKYDNISSGSTKLGGYFQTIYDGAVTNSLSTALCDVTFGYSTASMYYTASANVSLSASKNEKLKVYKQMASLLLGSHDNIFTINSTLQHELFFLFLKRNIMKDELKKGALSIIFKSGTVNYATGSDAGANSNFKLVAGGEQGSLKNQDNTEIGLVYYNAGAIVLDPRQCFNINAATPVWSGSLRYDRSIFSGTMDHIVDGFRSRVESIDLHNQTTIHSTLYFCRALNSEFNYSSNPTYLDSQQKIRVTSGSNILKSRAYITTIGLYDNQDNLLAVAKVNKPVVKSPDNEIVFRVRLDY